MLANRTGICIAKSETGQVDSGSDTPTTSGASVAVKQLRSCRASSSRHAKITASPTLACVSRKTSPAWMTMRSRIRLAAEAVRLYRASRRARWAGRGSSSRVFGI